MKESNKSYTAKELSELLGGQLIGGGLGGSMIGVGIDFGVHLLVKPFVKFLQWIVLPLLYLVGVAPEATVVLLIVGGGHVGRSIATVGAHDEEGRRALEPQRIAGSGAGGQEGDLRAVRRQRSPRRAGEQVRRARDGRIYEKTSAYRR